MGKESTVSLDLPMSAPFRIALLALLVLNNFYLFSIYSMLNDGIKIEVVSPVPSESSPPITPLSF